MAETGEFNLFAEEEALLRDCRQALTGDRLLAVNDPLYRLLDGYDRLLRETRHLVKNSDRREKEMNRLNRRLKEATSTLAYQADHDALTGLLNKGAITRHIEAALKGGDCALALYDIDFFKRVNDNYSHLAGDTLLHDLAETVQESLQNLGLLGRFGGEEFIVLFNHSSMTAVEAIAEHLRAEVEKSEFECGEHRLKVTVSIGVTLCQQGEAFERAYERVDAALYAAKRAGRNRVVVGF